MSKYLLEQDMRLAYIPSRWCEFLYDARTKSDGCLTKSEEQLAEAFDDSGWCKEELQDEDCRLKDAKDFTTELYSRLYENPQPEEDPATWAKTAHACADELPEFKRLKTMVHRDADYSAIATSDILETIMNDVARLRNEQK